MIIRSAIFRAARDTKRVLGEFPIEEESIMSSDGRMWWDKEGKRKERNVQTYQGDHGMVSSVDFSLLPPHVVEEEYLVKKRNR
jgi:hypothetical protein